jgi:hypothetical protein
VWVVFTYVILIKFYLLVLSFFDFKCAYIYLF